MRTIAIVNQKGGCGKTTTAINLAGVFARRGLRTLLVDMDPQSHCAVGLGVPEDQVELSIGKALCMQLDESFDRRRLVWEVARNLDLAPSTVRLAALEAPDGGLYALPDRDRRLERLLTILAPHYDRCLIDCPPTVGLLTFSALRAAREALIPVETGFFAMKGAERQWETVQRVISRIDRPIACHLLPTLYNPDSRIARDILASMRRKFAGQLTPVVIREHEALREAASVGQGVVEYAPDSEARRDYESLADWLANQDVTQHADEGGVEIEVMECGGRVPAARSGRANEVAQRLRQQDADPADVELDTDLPSELTAELATEPATELGFDHNPAAPPVRAPSVFTPVGAIATEPAAPAIAESPSTSLPSAVTEPAFYGVRVSRDGVRFVQPGSAGERVLVAGDFGQWATVEMAHDPDLGAHSVQVSIPPGRYQYRIVIGGRWRADPYNPQQIANAHGEINSVFVVPEGTRAP